MCVYVYLGSDFKYIFVCACIHMIYTYVYIHIHCVHIHMVYSMNSIYNTYYVHRYVHIVYYIIYVMYIHNTRIYRCVYIYVCVVHRYVSKKLIPLLFPGLPIY